MKIFLAGINGEKDLILKHPPKYVLESFFYIKDWQKELIKKCDIFLLDSGAFTFMNNFKGKIDWKEYIDRYANFIIQNDVKYFFELDIDDLVGYEEVKKMRKYLEEKTMRKCIPVWHRNRGMEDWKNITKNYDYVAIGGFAIKDISKREYKAIPRMLEIAKKNNCKVHGLGFTSMKYLYDFNFFSVDSTSWLSGARFGALHIFDGRTIKSVSFKKKRLKKDKNINVFNYIQWLKFQEYADKYL